MEKVWLNSYPEGMPATIELDTFNSLAELFLQSCNEFRELPAYTSFGKTITYAELEVLARDFAAYLQVTLGMQPGDRLAIMLPNVMQYPIAIFGAFLAGLVVVNVNPLYTPRELTHQLTDSGAKAILILENVAHVLEKSLPDTPIEHIITTRLGDCIGFPKSTLIHLVTKYIKRKCPAFSLPTAVSFPVVMAEGVKLMLTRHQLMPEDIAFLQYTGGTTGLAKGVELSHRNMVANVEQALTWMQNEVTPGKELVITALPLYHIFSLTANCLTFMRLGAHNLLIANPRDIPGFIKEMSKYRFTVLTGVNTLFNCLLNDENFAKLDFSNFKLVLGGGMAVQQAVAERWQEVTGIMLAEAYGLTETSPAAMINPLTLKGFNGSIGLPLPSTEVKIIDELGNEGAIGEVGELCIRGPQVMLRYWHNEAETKEVLDDQGWLKTGDIARVDEQGFVYIVDRKKDMIIVSGFNVYPNEIEDVLASCHGVLESAAIGIPDDKCGEIVKVFVVKKDPDLTVEAIIKHCRENLTRYKVPKLVEFRDSLPKTNVGKILRKELRDTKHESPRTVEVA